MTTETKKKRRSCKFNQEWLQHPDYKIWLQTVQEDDEMARCLICSITFSVKWDGVKAVKNTYGSN